MGAVLRSYGRAFLSLWHGKMLLLSVLPFVLAVGVWGVLLYLGLQPLIDYLQALFVRHEGATGERNDTVMSTVIGKFNLSERDISDIADFFSRLPPMKGTGKMTPLGKKGRVVFVEQKCIFCHDEADKSVQSFIGETVVIGGQNRSYLIKSMLDIRDRARIADGFDLMSKTVKHLSDEDIEAVAEYLSAM